MEILELIPALGIVIVVIGAYYADKRMAKRGGKVKTFAQK